MKTLRLLLFLIFFSYIKCQTLHRSLLDAAMQHMKSQNYLEENLRDITSIMVAQFLQELTYNEVQAIVKELIDLTEKCKNIKSHDSSAGCSLQLMTSFLEHICNNQEMADKQVFSDCCNASSTARHKCFLLHKKDDADYGDTVQIPNPERICEMDREKRMLIKKRYIYETSRKHPFLYGPTIMTISSCYETTIQSCCQEENKTECFQTKLGPLGNYIKELSLRHHHLCEIGIKFNHKVAKAVELVLLTKKQPKADFSEIAKLTTDVQNLHQTCCEGNTVACVLGRSQLMNYTCSKQTILSSKIAGCCELPVPFQGECIINSKNDDKPELSSLPLSRFTEDQFVCEQLAERPDHFLQKFLYEYSRRHPELAVPVILRVDTIYQNLLGKCCKLENPLGCYSHGKEMFQRVVRESHERIKSHCDLHKKLGDGNFHDSLIVLYTKKFPQLPAEELVMFTKNMAAAATKCCPLSDGQQFICMEDAAKLILGALCRRHEAEPINTGVGHCCDDSYAFRSPCFDELPVDGTYVSPSLSCDQVISLKKDLCNMQQKEIQMEKQKLLSNLVKQRPHATEMQFQSIVVDFTHLVERCCEAEKSEMCFQKEESKLIEKCQSLLGG
ncbi:alpha-fetoprotein-like [Talpa occidentalis]|uniref:alpha-fetoprotein-like n=1 Tax=Talpa occidentalis TaxID=50954 RepID=UPI00188F11B0|nr:alpha-fetoprotein-like [Talpa occidentalis]